MSLGLQNDSFPLFWSEFNALLESNYWEVDFIQIEQMIEMISAI